MSTIAIQMYSQKQYRKDEMADIIFEMTNQSDDLVHILKWNTPLEGLKSDCLKVTLNGKKVLYDGLFLKRGSPTADDFISLAPGASVREKVDLSEAYDVNRPGRIEVDFKQENLVLLKEMPSTQIAPKALNKAMSAKPLLKIQTKQADFKMAGGKNARKPIGEQMRRKQPKKKIIFKREAGTGALLPCSLNGGTSLQQQAVVTAHQNGYDLTQAVISSMENNNDYKTWFGAFEAKRFNKVKDDYVKMITEFETKTFTYDLTGTGCASGVFAYTTKGGTTIWLCDAFWAAPEQGTDSKAGTVVHEHSHASASTDDIAYGQEAAQALASADPAQAINNADSHEYYAKG